MRSMVRCGKGKAASRANTTQRFRSIRSRPSPETVARNMRHYEDRRAIICNVSGRRDFGRRYLRKPEPIPPEHRGGARRGLRLSQGWKSCFLAYSTTKSLAPSLSLKKILPLSISSCGTAGHNADRKAGFPCFAILGAPTLSAGRLFRSPPRGFEDEESLAHEPIAMRTFHSGSDWFLKRRTEEWFLLFWEADAILGNTRLSFQSFLHALDSP